MKLKMGDDLSRQLDDRYEGAEAAPRFVTGDIRGTADITAAPAAWPFQGCRVKASQRAGQSLRVRGRRDPRVPTDNRWTVREGAPAGALTQPTGTRKRASYSLFGCVRTTQVAQPGHRQRAAGSLASQHWDARWGSGNNACS